MLGCYNVLSIREQKTNRSKFSPFPENRCVVLKMVHAFYIFSNRGILKPFVQNTYKYSLIFSAIASITYSMSSCLLTSILANLLSTKPTTSHSRLVVQVSTPRRWLLSRGHLIMKVVLRIA